MKKFDFIQYVHFSNKLKIFTPICKNGEYELLNSVIWKDDKTKIKCKSGTYNLEDIKLYLYPLRTLNKDGKGWLKDLVNIEFGGYDYKMKWSTTGRILEIKCKDWIGEKMLFSFENGSFWKEIETINKKGVISHDDFKIEESKKLYEYMYKMQIDLYLNINDYKALNINDAKIEHGKKKSKVVKEVEEVKESIQEKQLKGIDLLKDIIKKNKLKRDELSKQLGISYATLNMKINGKSKMNEKFAKQLISVFKDTKLTDWL